VSIQQIKVGDQVGTMWVVSEGLKAGQRVVVEGAQNVRPGMQVSPKPFVEGN
jgi:membrane fusion protein (multidrug efflux system)